MPGTPFVRETAITPDPKRPGGYHATLTEEWCALAVPQGGIVATVAARAMSAAIGAPDQRLRSLSMVFAAPVPVGPVEIDVDVLRTGRSVAQASATVRAVGAPAGATAIAVFGGERDGFSFTDVPYPEHVPPPDECPGFRDPPPVEVEGRLFPYWDHHVEGRAAIGHAPWDEWEPTDSECAYWYRFDDPPCDEQGSPHPLALITLCDTMPGAVWQRMGGGLPVYTAPSADLTVHLFGDMPDGWVLAHQRAHFAGHGYASAQTQLWDPERRALVAFATQVMLFTFPERPPEPHERVPRDLH